MWGQDSIHDTVVVLDIIALVFGLVLLVTFCVEAFNSSLVFNRMLVALTAFLEIIVTLHLVTITVDHPLLKYGIQISIILATIYTVIHSGLTLYRFQLFGTFLKNYKVIYGQIAIALLTLGSIAMSIVIFVYPPDQAGTKGPWWIAHFCFYGFAGMMELIVAQLSLYVVYKIKTAFARESVLEQKNPKIMEAIRKILFAIAGEIACFTSGFISIIIFSYPTGFAVTTVVGVTLLFFSRLYFHYIKELSQMKPTIDNEDVAVRTSRNRCINNGNIDTSSLPAVSSTRSDEA
ncbi:hypothetical protein MP638_004305 [Amoeboaphelidium occidentale]|nr:hypothetical protein MP638_004305 [Amoeboaphelidium occidentale]